MRALAGTFCAGCGRSRDECQGCLPDLDPPRFCASCGWRLGVQVTPTGWRGSCRECERRAAARREVAVAGHRGDAATARGHLQSQDERTRATALGALRRAGDLRPEDLAEALGDPSATVRARAAELAAHLPGDGPPALAPLLVDREVPVVEAAAWASGERRPPEDGVVVRLADVAKSHDEPLCREAAVAALGAISDEQGLPAILAATGDRPAVRRRAVLALAAFGGPEVDAALEAARGDRDWQVRQAAEDVGGLTGPGEARPRW